MNYPTLNLQDLPTETRAALAARARAQTVRKYDLPASLFEQAETLVEKKHVTLLGHNYGDVWDNGWQLVTSTHCLHCRDAAAPRICVHKLAVWYADLLHRHITSPPPPLSPSPSLPLTRPGGYSARPRRRATRRANDGKHCPRCGGWLTATGGCNKCGGS